MAVSGGTHFSQVAGGPKWAFQRDALAVHQRSNSGKPQVRGWKPPYAGCFCPGPGRVRPSASRTNWGNWDTAFAQ